MNNTKKAKVPRKRCNGCVHFMYSVSSAGTKKNHCYRCALGVFDDCVQYDHLENCMAPNYQRKRTYKRREKNANILYEEANQWHSIKQKHAPVKAIIK